MKKTIMAIALSILFNACAPTIQYIGKSYNPTANVDLYMDTHDIKKDYEVIGKTDGISGVFGSTFEEIQSKIIEEAKKRGADGVIIYNMEQRVLGTTSSTAASWNTSVSNHRQWYDKMLFTNKGSGFSNTTSSNITENVLHADFIKYLQQKS
ncbi:hypothetical protein DC498_06275 [Terrimonas sp.]|uniref:hypothetical protein n=1 Tax=Terrimonas sp. TaxID=1914338 RepID=UPI000D51B504|nr:hypothetical protein [Terrimonas sp.]PVD52971.1 hypothetical protein DC498_06275 [Terrimonas sp.]